MSKYMRIQTLENSPHTSKPRGIFACGWFLIQQNVFPPEEQAEFIAIDTWFKKHLPIPDFYENGNPQKAITYFKTDSTTEMNTRLKPVLNLLDAHHYAYEIIYTDNPGEIIYEDKYQIAVI